MAQGNGAAFDGAKLLEFQGRPAADLYYSVIPVPLSPGAVTVFGAVRAVVTRDAHLLLGSLAGFPSAEAMALNYTSRDNPFLREIFEPFATSLVFR
jgi:hypothetical protein